ncbi:MAG: UDP-N-acetylmuramoyl-tripeptide--D-alanyl-D-alanine ligase [Magnetococcales bacterium]|nr:UDP-N-acetylmuramoyl-tripeptide--D-alanyl-D-alanine ligase [Magnetococcales bacterium]
MRLSFLRTACQARSGTGSPTDDPKITRVSTDSRQVQPGELFAALTGPNFDGHDFIAAAIDRGCAAILAAREPTSPVTVPMLIVEDVLQALSTAGHAWRHHVTPGAVIGITGSSGKTTVKEMVAACLRQELTEVHATQGNLNNHIGVPLTLLSMPATCQAAVIEMGMSAPGEIAHLTRLAEPTIGVVTNVQPAHMAAFASLEEIALAKGELFANLPPLSICLLPEDDPNRTTLAWCMGMRPGLSYGLTPGAQLRWEPDAVAASQGVVQGEILWPDGQRARVDLGTTGVHMVRNALAAAGAARAAGISPAAIGQALSAFAPVSGRGRIQHSPSGWRIIDDTYNANPGSMAAALDTLGSLPATRRMAILGDMLELGIHSERLHAQLATDIDNNRIDVVISVGSAMQALHHALANRPALLAVHILNPAEVWPTLSTLLHPDDLILVKGSRGMRMERIVKDLMNHAV